MIYDQNEGLSVLTRIWIFCSPIIIPKDCVMNNCTQQLDRTGQREWVSADGSPHLRGREKEFKFGNEGISTEKNSNQFEDSIGEEVFTAESKPFASQKKL